jgi:hypothetical protein
MKLITSTLVLNFDLILLTLVIVAPRLVSALLLLHPNLLLVVLCGRETGHQQDQGQVSRLHEV